MNDTTPQSLRLPGFYVEGRHFGNRLRHAESFAFALACEYMREINVVHNSPPDPQPQRVILTRSPAS